MKDTRKYKTTQEVQIAAYNEAWDEVMDKRKRRLKKKFKKSLSAFYDTAAWAKRMRNPAPLRYKIVAWVCREAIKIWKKAKIKVPKLVRKMRDKIKTKKEKTDGTDSDSDKKD